MDLGYNTTATGVVYFHRFYMFHSFRQFPRYITACCCLFLAGKVEETPKKCKDIIKTAKTLLSEQKFASFGEDPKEEVMTLERILLQTIKFDLQVEHPYSYLLKYAKCLKGDKTKLQKMVQMAWTFVNDSLCTTLALQWEPEILAVALMYLAGKLSKFEVVDWVGRTSKHLRWWDMFVEGVTMDLLEDICHQVLDLYSPGTQSAPADSPPLSPRTAPIAEKSSSKSTNGQEKLDIPETIPTIVSKPIHTPELAPYATYPPAAIPPTAFPYTAPAIPTPHIPAPPPGPPPTHITSVPPPVFPTFPPPVPTHFPPPNPSAAFYTPPPPSSNVPPPPVHRPPYYNQ